MFFKIDLRNKIRKGFAMIFAVLIGSIMFLIGTSMANIAKKETALSSLAKESRKAFYASDSGIECIMYLDVHRGIFEMKNDLYSEDQILSEGCFNLNIKAVNDTFILGNPIIRRMDIIEMAFPDGGCASMIISKYFFKGKERTDIISYGRNKMIGESCENPVKNRVQRALRVFYY